MPQLSEQVSSSVKPHSDSSRHTETQVCLESNDQLKPADVQNFLSETSRLLILQVLPIQAEAEPKQKGNLHI